MSEAFYGLMAEFDDADALLAAASRVRQEMPTALLEAYSPFPITGLDELLGGRIDRIPAWTLLGGLLGGLGTFAIEWYSAVVDYPIQVGGRPAASWQAFLPPAIEMTILGAALFGVLAMLVASRLPMVRHPLFAVPAFERASSDRFFLLIRGLGAHFDEQQARAALETLAALAVWDVPS